METILEKFANGAQANGNAMFRLGTMKEAVKRVGKGLNGTTTAITDRIEDGKMAAERLVKRGRHAVEDSIADTTHAIRRRPLTSIVASAAIGFAAGTLVGLLIPRYGGRRRWR